MKAVICDEFAPLEALRIGELPDPEIQAGHVRLAVKACSINYADTLIVQGLYQEKPERPFSPGMEAAGEIIEVGEGVKHLSVGMRVAALCGRGGLAEQVVVSADVVFPIPDQMSYEEAASFTVAYGTSHVALKHRAGLQEGEVLLVHGAAGGVGLTAVELGKVMGATVIATASTPEKMALAKSRGADYVINYTEENFRDRVKEITGRKGADVIYDPVGGDVFMDSLRCVAWEGRILVIGFASGTIPKAPVNLMLVKNASIVGVYWGAYSMRNPKVLVGSLMKLVQWYNAGKIKPHVSKVYPFEETLEAMRALTGRKSTGKVVVRVAE